MATYPGLSSEAFRHPLDAQAEQALRSIPGFQQFTRGFVEYLYERPQHVYLMGNCVEVGPRQYATIYGIFRECVRDLSLPIEPHLFVSQNPEVNSYSLGSDHPSMVINSGALDLLNEAELRTVIAHELGHIKCGHTVLKQMAIWAMEATQLIGDLTLGIGKMLTPGLVFGFYEWSRKAELSADRAAHLVVEDLPLVAQTMLKLAGGSQKYAHECSLTEFMNQAERYQAQDQDELNQIYKFLLYNGGRGALLTHPFPVERLHFLQQWSTSDQYQRIRNGQYRTANSEGAVNVSAQESDREVNELQRQVERLQAEIDRVRGRSQRH
ncbi:M48 family metallopeptidase [Spirulina major]|uniref:M48 family metallopeptidase n=1 Tax=Spirulina major TaxID=270636 RepID=UPI0009322EC2|nr:M48 family metallopeptidase [Spirulina major]